MRETAPSSEEMLQDFQAGSDVSDLTTGSVFELDADDDHVERELSEFLMETFDQAAHHQDVAQHSEDPFVHLDQCDIELDALCLV